MVGRNGFEPLKALSQQIYSLPRLTTSVPAHRDGVSKKKQNRSVGKTNLLEGLVSLNFFCFTLLAR